MSSSGYTEAISRLRVSRRDGQRRHGAGRWAIEEINTHLLDVRVSLTGNLADLGLGDIFQIVSMSRRTGILQVVTPQCACRLAFDGGRIVACSLSEAQYTAGQHLVDLGLIKAYDLQSLLAQEARGTQAYLLLRQGLWDLAAIGQALEALLKDLVYGIFDWTEGAFAFDASESIDPYADFSLGRRCAVYEPGLNPQYLAMEGSRLHDERMQRLSRLAAFRGGPATSVLAAQSMPDTSARALAHSLMFDDGAPAAPTLAAPTLSALAVAANHALKAAKSRLADDDWSEVAQAIAQPVAPHDAVPDLASELRAALLGDIETLSEAISHKAPTGCAPADGRRHFATLLKGLRDPKSDGDLTLLLLRALSMCVERGALFVLRAQHWTGVGAFSRDEAAPIVVPRVRSLKLAAGTAGVLDEVAETQTCLVAPCPDNPGNRALLVALAGEWHARPVMLMPLLVQERVVAVLIGDNPSGRVIEGTVALEAFAEQASLAFGPGAEMFKPLEAEV